MASLKLTREINVSRIEALLDKISDHPNQDIQIYESLNGASVGGEAALLQLLISWASRSPRNRLLLQLNSQDNDFVHQIEKLSRRAFGFVAMLMANDVLTADQVSCRMEGFRACGERVERIQKSPNLEESLENSLYGHRTFLPCVDHSTKSKISPFYYSNGQFRERIEFRLLVELLLQRRGAGDFVQNNQEIVDGLGSILFELVHNTHDWARTDLDQCPLRKSIRGILFTKFSLPTSGIPRAAGTNKGIAAYMTTLSNRNSSDRIRFVEMSVFDSGPGLAARWLAEPVSDALAISKEHEACIACFGKHTTTSHESYRGLGLYDVMQTLNQLSGFLRIRTGRIAMMRDFISFPLNESERKSGPILPLAPEHEGRSNGLADTVGTIITMLFPI